MLGAERYMWSEEGAGVGLKKPGDALMIVGHDDRASASRPSGGTRSTKVARSTRCQNSWSRASDPRGLLPAMRLALMAPIEVPMIQSGSMPASCRA